MTELILSQIVESIGLILLQSRGSPQRVSSAGQLFNAGIMSGSQIICAEGQAFSQQSLPFYIAVAGDTGIGRVSAVIFFRKIVDHMFPEFFAEVHHIKRNIQRRGYPPGILHCAQTAAAAVFFHRTGLLFLPDLHGDADHLIALFF